MWCYECDSYIPVISESSEHKDIIQSIQNVTAELELKSRAKEKIKVKQSPVSSQPKFIPTESLKSVIRKSIQQPGR